MDKTGIGPQQLLTCTQTPVKLCRNTNQLCEDSTPWQTKIEPDPQNQWSSGKEGEGSPRRKSDERDQINHMTATIVQQVDSLLQPDGTIITDPIQIHDRLTEAFDEHSICPHQHKHSLRQSEKW